MPKPSADFEKNFANLAYSYINNNAPKLLDSMVGFQVLDHEEDESKAIGVFGFAVGGKKKEMFYSPVFFLSGKLKGQELLYNGTADMFVPMEETWVDFILNKKPVSIGHVSDNTRGYLSRYLPNFRDMMGQGTTLYKGASAAEVDPDAIPAFYGHTILGKPFDITPALGMFLPRDIEKSATVNLSSAIQDSFPLLHAMAARMQQYGEFAKMASAFYSVTDFLPDDVSVEVKTVVKQASPTPPPVIKKAQVVTGEDVLHFNLTPEQKQFYVKSGFVVLDDRSDEEKSSLIDGDMSYEAPSSPGLYDVSFNDGSIRRCLVLKKDRQFLVYSKEEDVSWIVDEIYAMSDAPVKSVQDSNILSLDTPKEDSSCFSRYLVDLGEGKAYTVWSCSKIIESAKVHRVVEQKDTLIVPKGGYAILAIKDSWERKKKLPVPSTDRIQNLSDIFGGAIIKCASEGGAHLKFTKAGSVQRTASRVDAMRYLIEDLGLSKEASEYVITSTIEQSGYDFVIKRAYADYIDSYEPEAPDVSMEDLYSGTEPWSGAAMTEDYSRDEAVKGLPLNSRSDYGEMDPDVYGVMERAVATKQKDIFDVAVLSSLLKTTDSNSLIDKYIADMIKAVDKIGRSIFLLYSDPEGFKERYGENDLSDLEDMLKNSFTTLGKLVLFLKKRSITSDVDDDPVEV